MDVLNGEEKFRIALVENLNVQSFHPYKSALNGIRSRQNISLSLALSLLIGDLPSVMANRFATPVAPFKKEMFPMNSNQVAGQKSSQKINSSQQGAAGSQGASSERQTNQMRSEDRRQMGGQSSSRTSEQSSSEGSHLVEMFGKDLPQESRENIERMMTDATGYIREARTYVRENPGEAAGLVLTAGALLWALFGTKPGCPSGFDIQKVRVESNCPHTNC